MNVENMFVETAIHQSTHSPVDSIGCVYLTAVCLAAPAVTTASNRFTESTSKSDRRTRKNSLQEIAGTPTHVSMPYLNGTAVYIVGICPNGEVLHFLPRDNQQMFIYSCFRRRSSLKRPPFESGNGNLFSHQNRGNESSINFLEEIHFGFL